MTKIDKTFSFGEKEITLSFDLDTLDREEILRDYPELVTKVCHKLAKNAEDQIGRDTTFPEYREISKWIQKEVEDLIERENLKWGKIFLCYNYERVLFDYGWVADYDPKTETKEDLFRHFYNSYNDDWLKMIWEGVEYDLSDEIADAHALIYYRKRYSEWDYGPFKGRLLDFEGPEGIEKLAKRMEEVFHESIKTHQKAFRELFLPKPTETK